MLKQTLAPALYRSLLKTYFISNGMAKTSVTNVNLWGAPSGRLSMVLLESALRPEDLTGSPYTFPECSLLGSAVFLPPPPGWPLWGPVPALCTDDPWRAWWLFAFPNEAGVSELTRLPECDGTLQPYCSGVWAWIGGWRCGFIYSIALQTTCARCSEHSCQAPPRTSGPIT